jgi:spore coat polysaccharide biosynthesis protein SpsF
MANIPIMTSPRHLACEHLKFVGVITARLSSRRFRGKVLLPLHGRPMLSYIIDRLRSVNRLDEIVIATSMDSSDDPIIAFAEVFGIACWRGDLNDVLGRVYGAAKKHGADAVVRISGDSPLVDPEIIKTAIELFLKNDSDLVTNVFPRSFPKGQSVEILSRATLERIDVEATQHDDREHVTRYAYVHHERFKILNFSASLPRPELQLSVDTPADSELVAALIAVCRGTADFPTVDRLIELADSIKIAT